MKLRKAWRLSWECITPGCIKGQRHEVTLFEDNPRLPYWRKNTKPPYKLERIKVLR